MEKKCTELSLRIRTLARQLWISFLPPRLRKSYWRNWPCALVVFTIPFISHGSMFCSNQFLMGAVIKHFDLYYRTLSWRSIIVKLPPSPLFSLTGSKYTCSCYDSEYPPPLRAEASGRGMSFRFYSRQEPNQRMIGSAMYSLGQGIAHALTDGGHKWVL